MQNIFSIKENSIALVTGASGSIGAAISHILHKAGAHVILSGTNKNKLQTLAKSLQTNCSIEICDLSDLNACKSMMQSIKDKFARIDILVCNAGIIKDGFSIAMSDENFSKVLQVNLQAAFSLNREAIKMMLRNKAHGRIINMSSVVGVLGNAGQANYCASKAGIIGMTKALAREVASKQITINAIAPGFIESNMTSTLPEDIKKNLMQHIPQARLGTPEDVAHAALYLASEQASYITGNTLHVNGGMFMN